MPAYRVVTVRNFAIVVEADSVEEALDQAYSLAWENWEEYERDGEDQDNDVYELEDDADPTERDPD